jgi:hypothetical protein
MKNIYEKHDIEISVLIKVAPDFFALDIAMIDLHDSNVQSKYSQDEYQSQIRNGNVVVVLLEDDPIAYAIVHDGEIKEKYIEYSFSNSRVGDLIEDFVNQAN